MSEAEPLMRQALEILNQFNTHTGHQHPHTDAVINNYTTLLAESGISESAIKKRLQVILQEDELA